MLKYHKRSKIYINRTIILSFLGLCCQRSVLLAFGGISATELTEHFLSIFIISYKLVCNVNEIQLIKFVSVNMQDHQTFAVVDPPL